MAGDYSQKELEEVLAVSGTIMVAAKTYITECHNNGRHTLIYCVTKKICFLLAETVNKMLPAEEQGKVVVLTGGYAG